MILRLYSENLYWLRKKHNIVINEDVSSFKAFLDEIVEIYDIVSGNGIFNEIKPHVSEFLNLEKEYTSAVEFLK
ncbi:hypothetical protein POVWA2_094500 [Plasmodium ovale wallikeri]|uniref:PIR Superfamily Protein n=1 Tax=Plasmodium ovale wallikeri TaxID=864142 RepID=A0A1A9AT55_PLAOA|nr:hypothetical protein POVWA1_064240 [Plasmodium ovale wallikeri]SBT59300.1 hypothetical protein POVWA2_094500 [Plasmodium ovale wallikeri]